MRHNGTTLPSSCFPEPLQEWPSGLDATILVIVLVDYFTANGTPAPDADPQIPQGTWMQSESQSVYVGVCHVQLT